jgi:hypothetical protein
MSSSTRNDSESASSSYIDQSFHADNAIIIIARTLLLCSETLASLFGTTPAYHSETLLQQLHLCQHKESYRGLSINKSVQAFAYKLSLVDT